MLIFISKRGNGVNMKFYIDGIKIRDEQNRQRIFKGVNYCIKAKENDRELHKFFHMLDNEKDRKHQFDSFEANGVNIIRFGFTWAMVEPKENELDEKVISYMKRFVEECRHRNIYVILDCHQDLFYPDVKYGDGAPRWISSDYKQMKPVAIWAEGYFYMRDVQRAFNDFWRNKNNMQDKFLSMWKRVSNEFESYDNVIAFDYFNEPMINDNSNKVFCSLIDNALKQGLNIDFNASTYFKGKSEKQGFLKMAWNIFKKVKSPKRLKLFLSNLDNYDAFGNVVKDADAFISEFNENYYQPFFDRMTSECPCKTGFNMLEHSYYSNLGIPFSIDCPKNSIYSPHAYDIFIDSALYNEYSSNNRIKYILDNIKKNQEKMKVPVIMGEWGGTAIKGNEYLEHIDYVYSLIEQNQWSSVYWGYIFKNKELVKLMNRPYPVAVCGDIVSYHTDSKKRIFELEYNVSDNFELADTEIYVPNKGVVKYSSSYGNNKIKLSY